MNKVKEINLDKDNLKSFSAFFTGCFILTKDNKILLQKIDKDSFYQPNYISTFGGPIENGETPTQALVRELQEKLEITLPSDEIIFIGAIAEEIADYRELVYEFFWHDKKGILTDKCNDGTKKIFKCYHEILSKRKLIDDIPWIIKKCIKQGYIN